MSVATIITLARNQYYCDTTQIDDTTMLSYLNNVYHDLENDIVQYVGEDYYWVKSFSDSVAFQNSYSLPSTGSSTANGFKKLKSISVRYNVSEQISTETITASSGTTTTTYNGTSIVDYIAPGDIIVVTDNSSVVQTKYVVSINSTANTFVVDSNWTNAVTAKTFTVKKGDYIKCQAINISDLQSDIDYYNKQTSNFANLTTNQSQTVSAFRIVGNNIEIYPYTQISLKYGVKIEYIADQVDLGLLTTESSINIPWQFHNVMAKGLGQWIYQHRGMINEKNDAKSEYEKEKIEIIKELQDRDVTPAEGLLPNLVSLE